MVGFTKPTFHTMKLGIFSLFLFFWIYVNPVIIPNKMEVPFITYRRVSEAGVKDYLFQGEL